MSKREVKEVPKEECEECTVIVPEVNNEKEKKRRGRPKKEKEEKPKKPIGRPKSDTDIKTRRLLYGLTFFSKMLGLTDEEIEKKKDELLTNIKNGKVDANSYNHISEGELPDMKKTSGGKDSDKEMDV